MSDVPPESAASPRSRLRGLRDTVRLGQRVALRGVPRGMVALGRGAVRATVAEGPRGAHWKAVGDALVEILRSGGPALTKLGQILATRSDLLP